MVTQQSILDVDLLMRHVFGHIEGEDAESIRQHLLSTKKLYGELEAMTDDPLAAEEEGAQRAEEEIARIMAEVQRQRQAIQQISQRWEGAARQNQQ